jgi:hypothetical protein
VVSASSVRCMRSCAPRWLRHAEPAVRLPPSTLVTSCRPLVTSGSPLVTSGSPLVTSRRPLVTSRADRSGTGG